MGSFRGDPTETDKRLARYRKLLPNGASLTRSELEALRDQVHAFASVAVDVFLERRHKNEPQCSPIFESTDSAVGMNVQ